MAFFIKLEQRFLYVFYASLSIALLVLGNLFHRRDVFVFTSNCVSELWAVYASYYTFPTVFMKLHIKHCLISKT